MIDRKLPGLSQATDDNAMHHMLAKHLQAYGDMNFNSASSIEHHVLKYKPGKHCVIEYRLKNEDNDLDFKRVIGKLYRKNRGETRYNNLQRLYKAANNISEQSQFYMSEPLAYLAEIGVLIQAAVPGKLLSELSEGDNFENAIRLTGLNLSVLHGLTLALDEKKTVSDHLLKYCHPGPEVMLADYPTFRPLVEEVLAGLSEFEKELENVPICPIHGDLALTQIFISENRSFFIDFDGLCLSHAAFDISNFLVAVKKYHPEQSDKLSDIFLSSYLKSHSSDIPKGLPGYEAFVYFRRAMICFRLKNSADWQTNTQRLLETSIATLSAPNLLSIH